MSRIRCARCDREIDPPEGGRGVPSISGGIMGDEYIESYRLCPRCGVWTVEVVRDRFLGEEEVAVRGPLTAEEAEARIALIRRCPDPGDKRCRCAAHRAYFGDWLD